MTPGETAARLNLDPKSDYWVGISGGEPTLNRRWLLETIREIQRLAPDIRIQLDTNGSLLTFDYIDELVESGVTDISPDLKAKRLDTFMQASGVSSEKAACLYLETSWQAVRYLNDTYAGRVFMAVSVPCHPRLHSLSELEEIAQTLVSINPEIPVTVIEYQPAFRLRDWPFIGPKPMEQVLDVFKSTGLNKVILQGGSEMPRAIDPADLVMSSEEF
jgi:pyruvate formate lyase activating enzyme